MSRWTPWLLGSCLAVLTACGNGGHPPPIGSLNPTLTDVQPGSDGSRDASLDGTAMDGAARDGTAGDGSGGCPAGQSACGATGCSDPMTDPMNCGHCGNGCTAHAHQVAVCAAGVCGAATCAPGFGDCNHDPTDGCEVDLSTATNCGACGTVCSAPTALCVPMTTGAGDAGTTADGGAGDAGAGTTTFACGAMCPTGMTTCSGTCSDPTSDTQNCGACGTRCPGAPNAMAACMASHCGITCGSGFMHCSAVTADGCEVNTDSDTMHCGGCSTVCTAGPHQTAMCMGGMCRPACDMGFAHCSMVATDGCEQDILSDPDNCGGCGSRCRVTHGSAACMMGTCNIHCDPGYYQSGMDCRPIPPPRLVGPTSGSFVTSRRPTLRWDRGSVADRVLIQICRDRACAMVLTTIESDGTFVTPSGDLPPGLVFWRAHGGKDGSFGADASVAWEFVVGARTSTPLRAAWGNLFDANGDGLGDVAVGAPGSGGAYVFPGTTDGVNTSLTAATTLTSGATGFGSDLAATGDINGDGYSDLIVGAPGSQQVMVFHGSTTGLGTAPATMFTGGPGFGGALAPAGDVDADGYADVMIGAGGDNTARVYTGGMTGLTTAFIALRAPMGVTSSFGTAVAGVGDVNGDELADVVVGAPDVNSVFVYTGVRTSGAVTLSSATLTRITGPAGSTGFGASVASAGDVNGDGFSDVVVGAPGSGTAYVYYGAMAGIATAPSATLTGPSGVHFGSVVSSAGDVDGDGFGDVAVGAQGSPAVYVYHGSGTGLATTAGDTLTPPSGAGTTGLNVTSGLLGTGFRSALLLGDPANNRVAIYLPGASSVSSTVSATLSASAGSSFGASVYSASR